MKKFILKQWYPSLDNDFEVGDIVFYDKERGCYAKPNNRDIVLRKREVENNPDFWELIEEEKPKPLFITEDGVEIVFISQEFWVVNKEDFRKRMCTVLGDEVIKNWWVFAHESNADEYIWRNKRLFSYEDIMDNIYMQIEEDVFQQLAIERSNQ